MLRVGLLFSTSDGFSRDERSAGLLRVGLREMLRVGLLRVGLLDLEVLFSTFDVEAGGVQSVSSIKEGFSREERRVGLLRGGLLRVGLREWLRVGLLRVGLLDLELLFLTSDGFSRDERSAGLLRVGLREKLRDGLRSFRPREEFDFFWTEHGTRETFQQFGFSF